MKPASGPARARSSFLRDFYVKDVIVDLNLVDGIHS